MQNIFLIFLWSSLLKFNIFLNFHIEYFFLNIYSSLKFVIFLLFFQLWNCFLCFLYVDNFLLSACLLSGSWFYGTKYHGHFLVFIIEVLSLLDPWTVQYYFTDILIYCWLSVARVKFYHVRVVWLPVPRLHPCVLGSLEPASARGPGPHVEGLNIVHGSHHLIFGKSFFLGFFSRPGKARGCSMNLLEIFRPESGWGQGSVL